MSEIASSSPPCPRIWYPASLSSIGPEIAGIKYRCRAVSQIQAGTDGKGDGCHPVNQPIWCQNRPQPGLLKYFVHQHLAKCISAIGVFCVALSKFKLAKSRLADAGRGKGMDAVLSISPSMTPKIHIPQKFGLKICLFFIVFDKIYTNLLRNYRENHETFEQILLYRKI